MAPEDWPVPLLPLLPGEFDEALNYYGWLLIEQAMIDTNRNQIKAAKLLGISYHRFRALRRKFTSTKPEKR
jgi:hypothetical protein